MKSGVISCVGWVKTTSHGMISRRAVQCNALQHAVDGKLYHRVEERSLKLQFGRVVLNALGRAFLKRRVRYQRGVFGLDIVGEFNDGHTAVRGCSKDGPDGCSQCKHLAFGVVDRMLLYRETTRVMYSCGSGTKTRLQPGIDTDM